MIEKFKEGSVVGIVELRHKVNEIIDHIQSKQHTLDPALQNVVNHFLDKAMPFLDQASPYEPVSYRMGYKAGREFEQVIQKVRKPKDA